VKNGQWRFCVHFPIYIEVSLRAAQRFQGLVPIDTEITGRKERNAASSEEYGRADNKPTNRTT
jgi:hypothetical protein